MHGTRADGYDREISIIGRTPDYDLDDLRIVTTNAELKAMFHPLRDVLLQLTLERAASVNELAEAVERPPSTVAYHVGQLVDAGLLRVVRTRRRRAIEERFYGRTARIFYVGTIGPEQLALIPNLLSIAAAESAPAHAADDLRAVLRRARISKDQAATFWQRVLELIEEFTDMTTAAEAAYALSVGLYPVDHPSLPAAQTAAEETAAEETGAEEASADG